MKTAELMNISVDVPMEPMTLKQWEKLELPDGVKAEGAVVQEAGVVLWEVPLTERTPDIVVYPAELDESGQDLHLFNGQALLAVEIVSTGSLRLDRRVKLQEYQDADIPYY